jgi:hypothetical protein
MSPCTAKLSAYKSKHFLKYVGFPSVWRGVWFQFWFFDPGFSFFLQRRGFMISESIAFLLIRLLGLLQI